MEMKDLFGVFDAISSVPQTYESKGFIIFMENDFRNNFPLVQRSLPVKY